MDKVLFCRIGWMKWYQGLSSEDRIFGGGSFVDVHGYGHEMYNFQTDDEGNIYGFVEVGEGVEMALFRLGAKWYENIVSDVLVIWCATSPIYGDMRIVGWYRNATVYRYSQPCPDHLVGKRLLLGSGIYWDTYRIVAKAKDATLLKEDERDFIIPRATADRAGMGRKNIWYADSMRDHELRSQVKSYILNREKAISKKKVPKIPRREQDIEKRQKVELTAMKAVEDWYQGQGWVTEDVSARKLGWDIEARRDTSLLKIEVKGLSGDTIAVELTPKEYEQMKTFPSAEYRLCIVTNALEINPTVYHFSHDKKSDKLIDIQDQSHILSIKERTAAIISSS